MSTRRNQPPRQDGSGRDGRTRRGGQPNSGGNRGERRSFLERLRVREGTPSMDAPTGMRRQQPRRRPRRRRGEGWSITRILVIVVMVFIGLAVALSGLIPFIAQPGTGG